MTVGGCLPGGHFGKPVVDRHVGGPPGPVVLRGLTGVVIEGPEGAVGEALVVVPHLLGRQADGHVEQAIVFEWPQIRLGTAGPANPDPVVFPQNRHQGRDQPSGARLPAATCCRTMDREPIGDDHQIAAVVADKHWGSCRQAQGDSFSKQRYEPSRVARGSHGRSAFDRETVGVYTNQMNGRSDLPRLRRTLVA